MKIFLKNIFAVAMLAMCFSFVLTCAAVGPEETMNSLNNTAAKAFTGKKEGDLASAGIVTSLPGAIGKVLGVALSLVGVAFLILMIYGGVTWMLARGNDGEVTKAKDLIQAAIIGIVIVFAAYAITKFVGDSLM